MPQDKSDRAFQIVNSLIIVVLSFTMLAPLIHLAAISLSSSDFVKLNAVSFWPKGWSLDVYHSVFQKEALWRALLVSIYITVSGTLAALFVNSTLAYALSRPFMPMKKWILKGIIFTFVFSVPLIPYYLMIKALHMNNTLWALIIPGALSAFYVIIMKTFFQGISKEVFDAAEVDGCGEFGNYGRIVLPLSKPVLATIGLFHAVAQWNAYFGALIFIRNKDLYPMQVVLRSLVIENKAGRTPAAADLMFYTPEQMKAGIILFGTIPILLVYPFLQKYFVKGAMLGSLKE